MIRNGISELWSEYVPLNTSCSPEILLVVALGILWAFWRIWSFTILPLLHPDEPKEIPYLIPCRLSNGLFDQLYTFLIVSVLTITIVVLGKESCDQEIEAGFGKILTGIVFR